MNILNIDIALITIFLLATLYVGIRHSQGIKTIQDYALGGRNFSTLALVSTIVATLVSGSRFFTTLSKVYSDGLYFLLPSISLSIAIIIMATFLIPRMGQFLGKLSVADAMGSLYGKHVRIIVAIAAITSAAGFITVQFRAFGNIFSYFSGIYDHYVIILFGTIVTIYSLFGGIRGVTFTDILQFLAFGISIPIIGMIIWEKHKVLSNNGSLFFLSNVNESKFTLDNIFDIDNPKFLSMLPILFYFTIPGISPYTFQRISMGRNIQQVRKV